MRDVAAAGPDAWAVLESDLQDITRDQESQHSLRRAAFHARSVAPLYFEFAADALAERKGVDQAAALADVEGFLNDLAELLEEFAG